ncbi:deaminase [Aliiroseovarius sp. F47248L]|uniref:deoxycytidylate deaminase n=1 Tax=Aliiroseovarius sp. F47248L TaxID=2926420 RepID=UPI001FF287E5|nr:deaminase [Aliiroseovarius sp. F47248L]MCK0138917.1 deaminase [Aliiroseovarius sp. F47248L]
MMLRENDILTRLKYVTSLGECQKRKVGSLLVVGNEIQVEAYNGMPEDTGLSCMDGDCPRCRTEVDFPHGVGYDLCFCLHAEEKVIAKAAQKGVSTSGAILYSSYQPCIMCLKKICQSGIIGVRYIERWEIPNASWGISELEKTYRLLASSLPLGLEQIEKLDLSSRIHKAT